MHERISKVKREALDNEARQRRALHHTQEHRAQRSDARAKLKKEIVDAVGVTPVSCELPADSASSPRAAPLGHAKFLKKVRSAEKKASAVVRPACPQRSEDSREDDSAERLGNNTKSQAAFEVRDIEIPELIQRFKLDERQREFRLDLSHDDASAATRQGRFVAQSSVSKLLSKTNNPAQAQWRVTGCSRRKIAPDVVVMYSPSIRKAHFGNLMICGSVWTCPVCAAKISEGRKVEIKSATDQHKAAGGSLYMVTFTFSHQRHDVLEDTMERFKKARKWMREQRAYKRLKLDYGYVGDIRALEVTYGNSNGWHPHEHGLWFVSDHLTQVRQRQFKNALFALWFKACEKAGLAVPNREHGVDVIHCLSAAEYLAKFGREQTWGVSSELSKQHIKTGSGRKGMTPFDLLRSYELGNKHHGALFLEYANAFFGKRQIMWSDGLKAIFGVRAVDDQTIATEELSEDAAPLLSISSYEWKVVLSQPYDIRAFLLQLAEIGERTGTGEFKARTYIDDLVSRSDLVPF